MSRRTIPLIELLKNLHPERSEKELFAEILSGRVMVGDRKMEKPGTPVAADAVVRLRPSPPYVSRGGEKLAKGLAEWGVECAGSSWIDAGCSTGGFTDCLLQKGASRVVAVDVGKGQLDWRLRQDSRVMTLEGTNVMDLRPQDPPFPVDRAAADLSFRSLRRAASHILGLTREGWGIFLVKPQFEWTDPPADFRGVVKEPRLVLDIARSLLEDLAGEGLWAEKATVSPILGHKGNRELLVLLRAHRAGESADNGPAMEALARMLME